MIFLEDLQQTWEFLAQLDPLRAICVKSPENNKPWDLSDFLATGEKEIQTVLQYVNSIGLSLDPKGTALDFGCGVGRLTQAMSRYFDRCYGVDISPTMIKLANEINKYKTRCLYYLNCTNSLPFFEENYFCFIYSSIVLQHIHPKYSKEYLKEFMRILSPRGMLIFQTCDRINSKIERIFSKLELRRKIQKFLVYSRITKQNQKYVMRMYSLSENIVRQVIESMGGNIIDIRYTNSTDLDFNGNIMYFTYEPKQRYISKQYCIIKNR